MMEEYNAIKLKEAIMKKRNLTLDQYLVLLKRKAKNLKKNGSLEKPLIALAKQLKIEISEFKL